jgi:L-amino acid N-acyltransferase YncA
VELYDATSDDAAGIAAIYNHYVLSTVVSMEYEALAPAEMAQRVAQVQGQGLPWLVLRDGDGVVGYAYASLWRTRYGYRHAVESSVYLAPSRHRGGLGTRLYQELLDRLRASGCHAVIGGIALPNPASVALHEKLGFEQVAHFREVGHKLDRWVDVGYWQLTFDPAQSDCR